MFSLTIEFDLSNRQEALKELEKYGYSDVAVGKAFLLEKKSDFVPRVGDHITHYTTQGHVELSGKVVLVNFITDEEGKESFYILVDPTEAD